MKTNRFVILFLGLLSAGFLVVVCLGSVAAYWLFGAVASKGEVGEDEPTLDRIAFVGNDGNLWLVSPDGEGLRALTVDGRGYHFPTWAPDGRRLAFIGPDEAGVDALYVSATPQGDPEILYSRSGSAPFYVYWSPDSRAVTFLTQEASNLAMRLADADNPGTARLMAVGAPIYWAWSPAGDQLLMHVGGARAFSEEAHLSLLENKADASRVELEFAPGRFQAPAWSADGQYIFYIGADDGGQEAIYKTKVETREQTLIAPLTGIAHIVLAPDSKHIAYLNTPESTQFLGTAYVVDTEGQNERRVMEEPVVAMYWSPDGKKLALLAPAQGEEDRTTRTPGLAAPLLQRAMFRWWIYSVQTGALEPLGVFQPTIDFLQTIPYFDQYHLSLTFWSPDSRFLVTTQRSPDSDAGTVWVLDITEQQAPLQVGEGTLAVWSWR